MSAIWRRLAEPGIYATLLAALLAVQSLMVVGYWLGLL